MAKKRTKEARFTLALDEETLELLRQLAKRDGRSAAGWIRHSIQQAAK